MIVVGPQTVQAIASHAIEKAWVLFIQTCPSAGIHPIKIEGIRGQLVARRLRDLAADNPFPVYVIGIVETETPSELARMIQEQHVAAHLHDGWFEPTPELLGYIQHIGQEALQDLLVTSIPEGTVDIEAIARYLGVSVPTIRRQVAADAIPHYRVGRQLRFDVQAVLAAIRRG